MQVPRCYVSDGPEINGAFVSTSETYYQATYELMVA